MPKGREREKETEKIPEEIKDGQKFDEKNYTSKKLNKFLES